MIKGRMPYRACGPFLLAVLLAGCGDETRPSGDENRQLESAEEMLNKAPGELADIDENALAGAERAGDEPQ